MVTAAFTIAKYGLAILIRIVVIYLVVLILSSISSGFKSWVKSGIKKLKSWFKNLKGEIKRRIKNQGLFLGTIITILEFLFRLFPIAIVCCIIRVAIHGK